MTARPILVTGAAGFIGAAVTRRLAAAGEPVVALVRPGSDLRRLGLVGRDIGVVRVDLGDERALRAEIARLRPAACVHLAAAGAVVPEGRLSRLLAVNALSPAVLAETLADAGCDRLVTAGSSSEYGPCDGPMDEGLAPLPDDPYGAAKLAGGLLARSIALRAGMAVLHLRVFSGYGPGEDPRRLVPSVLASLLRGDPVELTPGGQVRDFVYLEDVVDAFAAAVRPDAPSGAILNVGTGVQTTVRALALLAAEVTGADPGLLRFGAKPYRPHEIFSWRAATSTAERVLGWRARTTLRDGLERTTAALRRERYGRRVA